MKDKKTGTVFIVDDDPFFIALMARGIETLHIKVKRFLNPESLFEALMTEEKPDIIFLDYNFGGYDRADLDGLEILKKIKQRNPLQTVIMVSGEKDPGILVKATQAGAYSYLVKSEYLFTMMTDLLRNYYYKTGYDIE